MFAVILDYSRKGVLPIPLNLLEAVYHLLRHLLFSVVPTQHNESAPAAFTSLPPTSPREETEQLALKMQRAKLYLIKRLARQKLEETAENMLQQALRRSAGLLSLRCHLLNKCLPDDRHTVRVMATSLDT
ncbi:unnamed protein product [Protopolystoma xenopodis]|uniref:Uncharacterized protein n=1 Tax=Protopolystoma xenopodis TaxID=117903 RepID=A0A448X6E1_9PLAT|nr:unnamed protein product [Protopolystoma xenopodis]